VGISVIPEIVDLNIARVAANIILVPSLTIKFPGANKDPEHLPDPKWPGQVGNQYLSPQAGRVL
jgi:endoglucanase